MEVWMFDTVLGLPVHALVVHAVVVFLPLACLGAIAVSCVPRWNRTFGFLVVGSAAIAAVTSYVAVESGEVLSSRIGLPADHYQVARWLPWFALALLVTTMALWFLDRRRTAATAEGTRTVMARGTLGKVVAILNIIAALLAMLWVVRTGHSGAEAVWGQIIQHTTPGSRPVP
jgi:hypothetical protein